MKWEGDIDQTFLKKQQKLKLKEYDVLYKAGHQNYANESKKISLEKVI